MKRQSWDDFFMNIAKEVGKMSTCISHQVGCVLVKDRHIIATGYNGVLKGRPHCNEIFSHIADDTIREEHHTWSLKNELHAEVNAVLDAGRRGTLTPGMTLYVTLYPCQHCTKIAVAAGVTHIIYAQKYDLDPELDMTKELGISISHYQPKN
jgi:dCMP deaminase